MRTQIVLREITTAARDLLNLAPPSGYKGHTRSDAVAVRFRARGANGDPVARAFAFIVQKRGWIILVVDENIEPAVIVQVAEGYAASGATHVKTGTRERGDVFESAVAGVVIEKVLLSVL